jgi:hypothetical protein
MKLSSLILPLMASGKLISDEVATKTLVLLDSWATIETHSLFFNHLKASRDEGHLDHDVEFAMASEAPVIKYHDK